MGTGYGRFCHCEYGFAHLLLCVGGLGTLRNSTQVWGFITGMLGVLFYSILGLSSLENAHYYRKQYDSSSLVSAVTS